MGKLWLVALSAQLGAQSLDSSFFESKIRPVLSTSCYGCHSSKLKAPMGGLVLDTKAGLQSAARGRLLQIPAEAGYGVTEVLVPMHIPSANKE